MKGVGHASATPTLTYLEQVLNQSIVLAKCRMAFLTLEYECSTMTKLKNPYKGI